MCRFAYWHYSVYLFIYYFCCRSLFKTWLFFFKNTHLEKVLTCISVLSLSVTAQVPLCDHHGGLQRNAPACAMHRAFTAGGPHSFLWFLLLVHLRLAVRQQITCSIPCVCSSSPLQKWQWGEALQQTWDAVHGPCESRPVCMLLWHCAVPGKASIAPQWARIWDCNILLALPVFWGSKIQQALLIKNRSKCNWNENTSLDVQKFEPALNLSFSPAPHLVLIIWKMCKIAGVDDDPIM